MLGSKETAPLGESGGTVQLEIRSAVKGALLIEMIVHRGTTGDKFLQTPHAPEAEHSPLPSSKGLVRVFSAVAKTKTAI
jgi:hypothetical protein